MPWLKTTQRRKKHFDLSPVYVIFRYKKRHCSRFSSKDFGFTLSVSFNHSIIPISYHRSSQICKLLQTSDTEFWLWIQRVHAYFLTQLQGVLDKRDVKMQMENKNTQKKNVVRKHNERTYFAY